MKVNVFSVERMNHGYLASNQLVRLLSGSPTHFKGTVVTNLSKTVRSFSWVWLRKQHRAVLVNRVTGTAYDPHSGRAINSSPRILEAPIKVPQFELDRTRELPVGIFSTSQV